MDSFEEKILSLYQNKKYAEAENQCRKILKKKSDDEALWLLLGNIYFEQNLYEKARSAYQKSYDLNPQYFPAIVNLANVFLEESQYEKSRDYANLALKSDSKNQTAMSILSLSLLALEQYDKAEKILTKAIREYPQDAWMYNYLSRVYQQKEKNSQALDAGWQAIILAPSEKDHHINFGYMLYELMLDSPSEEVEKYIKLWQQNFPQNEVAEYMGNALLGKSEDGGCRPEYIKNIFDAFASDFDSVLKGLGYATPHIIGEFLKEIYGQKLFWGKRILDAGCGTGLCGKYLKPYAGLHKLEGVDLSEKMLAEAQKKKIYDRLFCNDIICFLKERTNRYDLIVSADVLTYFGSLDSLFEVWSKGLKKNGRIIFSITSNEVDSTDYVLHLSGRFQHHINYVKELIKRYGFSEEKQVKKVLREEGGNPVWGYVISIKKA